MTRAKSWLLAITIVTFTGCLDAADEADDAEVRASALTFTQYLQAGEGLYAASGDVLYDQSGKYRLVMQGDCNLVLYSGGTPLWNSRTVTGERNCRAMMQSDGNLVVYNTSRALWSSGTQGHPNSFLTLQGDRNLVLYQRVNGGLKVLWQTDTDIPAPAHAGCQLAYVERTCSVPYTYCTNIWSCSDHQERDPRTTCGTCF